MGNTGTTSKRRKKKSNHFTMRVIARRKQETLGMFILLIFIAFTLDVLRILKNLILGILALGIVTGIIACIVVWIKVEPYYTEYNEFAKEAVENATESTFKMEESTYIYDNEGNVLVKLRGNQDSTYIEYDDIPVDVVNAFIAVEDRTFWDNPGIDLKGIIRVGLDYIQTKGEERHGASTITQQLARNIFLTHEVSLERKAKEILIATKLTSKFSKKQIMEYYCNDICFANAFYGIEAAANGYFNTPTSELSLSQITYLCAIPNSPEYYNPYKYEERALARRDKILDDMYELGYITKTECFEAKLEEIEIERPEYSFNNYQSTFAIDCATRYLMEEDGFEFRYTFDSSADYKNYKSDYNEAYNSANAKLVTGGYKIYTTLDTDIQNEMQGVLDSQLSFDEEVDETTGVYALQGAITIVDNNTGKVLALIGGRSQESDSQTYSLNRAYQSARQPGSSIKPLAVYTPALMSGYKPTTIVQNIDVTAAKEKGVDVQALTGDMMTLRSALEQSKNGVAWQIFDRLGAKYALSFVNNMKFASICPDDYYNSASLGGLTYGVTTVEMAGAYSTLVNHGEYREATCIDRIIDSTGSNVYTEANPVQVYDKYAADTMVDMMTGVLKVGTAAKLNWYNTTDMIAACKTGTTNASKDGWLCGFTPPYTVTVWVGYDQPRTLNNLYGATYPGQIWKETMLRLIDLEEPVTEFELSDGYEEAVMQSQAEADTEEFLPGRLDEEMLSDSYSVADYRNDREIGKGLQSVIDGMYTCDKSDASYVVRMQTLYAQGQEIINLVYSRNYSAELQQKLDWTYNALLAEAGY